MSTDTIPAFESSLSELGVDLVRTTAREFDAALDDVVEQPAVGVPLPFAGVSLPDAVSEASSVDDLEDAATGVTPAGYGIASYGSVVLQGGPEGVEPVSLYGDTHIAVVAASDVLPDMADAIPRIAADIRDGRGEAVVATGASATADMGALVQGVHGPTNVVVVVLTDR